MAMRFNVLNRKVHYWLSAVVALPLLVIVTTGLLLQVKKHWAWVQPPELRGTVDTPAIELSEVLRAVAAVDGLGVDGWEDVDRVDVRPGKGIAKVLLHDGVEVQVDRGTGTVLQVAARRSDFIESLHDGSFLGEAGKLGVFLPAGIGLLLLWVSGMWLWLQPLLAKRERRRSAAQKLRRT